jgi:hypothetical protein
MKANPSLPHDYLEALADAFFGPGTDNGPAAQAVFIPKLAVFTAALGVHLVSCGASALIRRIRYHFAPPQPPAPPRPSPSLRGTPAPGDIASLWELSPRTLQTRLRIGSRLADLEPTLDNTFVFKDSRRTRHRIVARRPGLKGWLKSNLPGVAYSTAVHYKKLATRLRQLAGLDPRIPLEWLLPGDAAGPAGLAKLPPADRRAADSARRKIRALLADNRGYTRLVRAVEQRLGIMRLASIRRIESLESGHPGAKRKRRKARGNQGNPMIPRTPIGTPGGGGPEPPETIVCGGKAITLDGPRTTAFWDAIRRILGETDPDPATLRLQRDIRSWLAAPLPARLNRRR